MFKKIGFIGTGNMGGTVAACMSRAAGPETDIYLYDTDTAKAAALAEKTGGKTASLSEIADICGLIVLGVKPQVLPEVLAGIRAELSSRKDRFVLLSMAAGISTERIAELTDSTVPVIRIMPNTPLMAGKGIVLYCQRNVTEEEIADFTALLSESALTDPIPEHLIDAAAALTGCGPAYVYMLIEALADGAVACGLPRDRAQSYAAAMVEGAAKMVRDTGLHPGELKDMVCSPGGTTIAGVHALEHGAFRSLAMESVIAAYKKTEELKK